MRLTRTVALALAIIIAVLIAATVVSSRPFFGSGVATITSTVRATSTQTETIFSTKNDTVTITSTETNTQTSTTTNYTTESTTLTTTTLPPIASENPTVLITSATLVVVLPSYPIYNATVVDEGTEAVTNVTMVFQNSTFFSNVTKQNPLLSGQSTSFEFIYRGIGGNPNQPEYLALVYGTFQDGQPFAFADIFEFTR